MDAERKPSIPNKRAAAGKATVASVRRRYKQNLNTRRKLAIGEIPHIENMLIILHIAGYNKIQIARIIGLSRRQVDEMFSRPEVQEEIVALRARLPQAALELLEGYMIEAVQAIVDVMRRSNNDKYILQAAGEVLDRAGMPKASRQERYIQSEERTTFTDDGIVERLREASPEVQEEAAQIIEKLEGLLGEHADVISEGGEVEDS